MPAQYAVFFFLCGLASGAVWRPSAVYSAPTTEQATAQYTYTNHHDGNYKYRYDTQSGTSVEEEGTIKDGVRSARGQYSYISPEGKLVTVTWEAGVQGYRASFRIGPAGAGQRPPWQSTAPPTAPPAAPPTTPPTATAGPPAFRGTELDPDDIPLDNKAGVHPRG